MGICGQYNCFVALFLFVFAVAGEFLWLPLSGGLAGVPQGYVVSQHSSEPADLCASRFQVP